MTQQFADAARVLAAHRWDRTRELIECEYDGWYTKRGPGAIEAMAGHHAEALAAAGLLTSPGSTPEQQVWERRIPGTDVPLTRVHLAIGPDGRALVHEAVLAQLLTDAGWERAQ
ncbi:hypothetical protein QWY28_13330 [Nocardioides sp. SOB77]|uniref:Uncharacterized protein n=1 Tax=Nocardioides oceani TaxID=3058369 RepID=A0ABT8FIH2_9ACTN|nr:hypothetical protein [Nocardioides oceani]MDN4173937.1 hypothetical protein [Nocardioides oceani]